MRYFDFGDDATTRTSISEIVEEYRKQADCAKAAFPPDMSEGDRLIAWMLMVNAHAVVEMLLEDEPDEPWKD